MQQKSWYLCKWPQKLGSWNCRKLKKCEKETLSNDKTGLGKVGLFSIVILDCKAFQGVVVSYGMLCLLHFI
jgi:hypothetical protein